MWVRLKLTREKKCDVTLPWKHYVWMATKPTTTATARRTAKNNMFMFTKNNFTRASCYFVHFCAVVTPLRHETSQFHKPALWSRWAEHKNCRFLFLNLDNDRYGLKKNFAKICQIKCNWIRLMKFQIVWTDFYVTLSVCCHPKILLPWQRDVTTSPLYY